MRCKNIFILGSILLFTVVTKLFPVPQVRIKDIAYLSLTIKRNAKVEIILYNHIGEQIKLSYKFLSAGINIIQLNAYQKKERKGILKPINKLINMIGERKYLKYTYKKYYSTLHNEKVFFFSRYYTNYTFYSEYEGR